METLISAPLYASGCNYQLLGHEKQTLQVALMPGQAIRTKRDALIYSSDNCTCRSAIVPCCTRIFNLCRRDRNPTNLELVNDTSSIAYAGLQLMKGKIIVIDNQLSITRNLVIKDKYIIAHTTNVQMRWFDQTNPLQNREPNEIPADPEFANQPINLDFVHNTNGLQMSQAFSRRDEEVRDNKKLREKLTNCLKNETMLAQVYSEHVLPSRELIFLQSQSNFIEKSLGQGERIKIRLECLVAHAPSVRIIRSPANDFDINQRGQLNLFSSKNKFITLQGPGIVYIDMQAGSRFFKEIQLNLFTVIMYCCLYMLMLVVVTFDKVEALRMLEQREMVREDGGDRQPNNMRLGGAFNRLDALFGRNNQNVQEVQQANQEQQEEPVYNLQ